MNTPENIQIVDTTSFLEQVDPENRLIPYFDLLRSENRKTLFHVKHSGRIPAIIPPFRR